MEQGRASSAAPRMEFKCSRRRWRPACTLIVHMWQPGAAKVGAASSRGPAARRAARQLERLVRRRAVLPLAQNLLGEPLDGFTRLGRESRELVRVEKTVGVDGGKFPEHSGSPRIVESVGQLFVSVLEPTVEIEIALMMTTGGIQAKALHFIENALAEPLECDLPEFAKDLPVGFRKAVSHCLSLPNE